ncbi:MAG: OmpA family protein [Acidobacteriota bacterium]
MKTDSLAPIVTRRSATTAAFALLLFSTGCASTPEAPALQALVISEPAGQQVLLRGKPVGVSPLELGLEGLDEAASLTIKSQDEEKAIERRIQILSPQSVRVMLTVRDEPSALAKALGLQNILVFDYGARASFEVNSAEVSETVLPLLRNQAEVLEARFADLDLFVCGHTDSSGADDFNRVLSLRRAQAVADVLTQNGLDAQRLKVQGFASDYPLAPNDTAENKALNRRTEIVIGQN